MAGCLICNQLKGSLRCVYSQATPIYDVVIGRTWSFDSIYWSHRSRHGNKYIVAGRESHAGYLAGAHFPNRQTDVCMDTMEQLIVSIRTDPNLGPNNFIETIFFDPAGKWGPDDTKAMERFKTLHIQVSFTCHHVSLKNKDKQSLFLKLILKFDYFKIRPF